MGVQDAIPQGYRRGLTSCPVCGRDDGVSAVPAVYESSHVIEETIARAQSIVNDDDSSRDSKASARATLAATPPPSVRSRQLALAPTSRWATCLVGAVFLAFPAGFVQIMAESSRHFSEANRLAPDPENATLAVVALGFAALSAACVAGMVAALIRRGVVHRGRGAADAVWRRGWYCGRCALVHFAPGEEPPGVLMGQVLDPDQFRALVWTAGGYGNRVKPGGS